MLELVTAPALKPVLTADMLTYLKLSSGDDDTNVAAVIAAATSYLDGRDGILNRALITQTWKLHLDEFPDTIELPVPPLQSVTSITYVDGDGTTQTLSASLYTVSGGFNQPATIKPSYDNEWPVTRDVPAAVKVTFVAGYGDADTDVPDALKIAIKLLAADLYENRQDTFMGRGTALVQTGVMQRLIAPYIVRTFY